MADPNAPTAPSLTPAQESRIREIIREEDYLMVNLRYPAWAKGVDLNYRRPPFAGQSERGEDVMEAANG